MSGADARHSRRSPARALVTGQAAVGVEVDLIVVDGVRDHWRRLGRARLELLGRRVFQRGRARYARRRVIFGDRRIAITDLGPGCEGDTEQQEGQTANEAHHGYTSLASSMLTAHFLKSVCSEIGSVASRISLLISRRASKKGTNTIPRGMVFEIGRA